MWLTLCRNSSWRVVNECMQSLQYNSPFFFRFPDVKCVATFLFLVWFFSCCLSWSNSTKFCWHSLQEGTGQSFIWAVKSWIFCFTSWQRGHLKRSDWQIFWWRWSESFLLNNFLHFVHLWTILPCLVLRWRDKASLLLNVASQTEQICFPSFFSSGW